MFSVLLKHIRDIFEQIFDVNLVVLLGVKSTPTCMNLDDAGTTADVLELKND